MQAGIAGLRSDQKLKENVITDNQPVDKESGPDAVQVDDVKIEMESPMPTPIKEPSEEQK